ncbi:M20/M25/M40 family metallo-hydrolase [Bacillus sp. FJAT-45037]|uniref:M20/M25/M40 family metallo-hydrolase n=1 Tax=Bacillus sp. FJAT-45037 TaxID=2011007 RepID=UPI000C24ED2C|nr:M20/M25/M40 family metallo-hydrolase [Bacillus sp. FJAT-45037]
MKGLWGNSTALVDLLKVLVSVPSIVGTNGEVVMGEKIISLIKEIDYFKENPDQVVQMKIKNDQWGRFSVAAVYEGNPSDNRAYVLLSHFDVVGIDDFGQHKYLAFDCDRYTEQMQKETVAEDVAKDVKSGDWLFGRGVMDMKAGLAIQMAIMADAIAEEKKINIILLATPDEERNSEGMLASVEWLAEWKRRHQYEEMIGICSEPSFTSFPGDEAKYIYTGSVGKMLPLVCAVGRETHVGEPLAGVNASWMISEVVCEMELSDRFVEEEDGDLVPPPTVLRLSDLKYEYNVQTPTFAYATFNVLTYKKNAQEVLDEIGKTLKFCTETIHQRLTDRYKTYQVEQEIPAVSIYSFGELRDRGVERNGKSFLNRLENVAKRVEGEGGDTRDVTIALARELGDSFSELAPFYVMMFAPPYYPAVSLRKNDPIESKLLLDMSSLQKWTEEQFSEKIIEKRYFPGLSDVSYGKIEQPDEVRETLERNMPTLFKGYELPLASMQQLNMPTVNIGPYGKDAHKRTERLHLPFFTNVAPAMLKQFIDKSSKG